MVACLDQWRQSIIDCDDAGLPDQVRDIESVSRMVYSVMLNAVGELESRNIAGIAGFRNTKQLLAGMLNLSATEAGTRVTHEEQLAPRRTLGGEVLAPLLPNTSAALAPGEIGPGQVRVITETINAIPSTVNPADRDAAEAELAHHARSCHPMALHKIGQRILAHLDPDGPAPPRRAGTRPSGGGTAIFGPPRRGTRVGGIPRTRTQCAFRTLIEQLAAPRPAAEGIPDARTAAQRNADALLEVCGLARAAQDCPSTAGEPPHLTVTIDKCTIGTYIGPVGTFSSTTDASNLTHPPSSTRNAPHYTTHFAANNQNNRSSRLSVPRNSS